MLIYLEDNALVQFLPLFEDCHLLSRNKWQKFKLMWACGWYIRGMFGFLENLGENIKKIEGRLQVNKLF